MDTTVDQNIPTKTQLCTSSSRCCCHRWLGGVWEEGAVGVGVGSCLLWRNWEGRGGGIESAKICNDNYMHQ
jgi:hypothetical protein